MVAPSLSNCSTAVTSCCLKFNLADTPGTNSIIILSSGANVPLRKDLKKDNSNKYNNALYNPSNTGIHKLSNCQIVELVYPVTQKNISIMPAAIITVRAEDESFPIR